MDLLVLHSLTFSRYNVYFVFPISYKITIYVLCVFSQTLNQWAKHGGDILTFWHLNTIKFLHYTIYQSWLLGIFYNKHCFKWRICGLKIVVCHIVDFLSLSLSVLVLVCLFVCIIFIIFVERLFLVQIRYHLSKGVLSVSHSLLLLFSLVNTCFFSGTLRRETIFTSSATSRPIRLHTKLSGNSM